MTDPPRWWTVRAAQNRKPATYRCPFCGELLPALSEHVLVMPEGDARRRRHAHTACALAERQAGRLRARRVAADPTGTTWPAPAPCRSARRRALSAPAALERVFLRLLERGRYGSTKPPSLSGRTSKQARPRARDLDEWSM